MLHKHKVLITRSFEKKFVGGLSVRCYIIVCVLCILVVYIVLYYCLINCVGTYNNVFTMLQ